MKSDTSSRKLPASAAQWDKVITQAPGKDRAATGKEQAARHEAVVVAGGGYGAVRDALAQKRQGQRGPQHRPTKTPVTVRYDPEVVAYFKGTGAGWQTRMNEVLCEWVAKRGSA
jgi:uncharacterized protein (DUF4415 family)